MRGAWGNSRPYRDPFFAYFSIWPNALETSRKNSDVSLMSKTTLVDWHSGQMALSIYSLFPEPGDLKKTCEIPNCPAIYELIFSWVSSSENSLLGTPDTANSLRAKLPRWLHFEHRTGLSESNFGKLIVATVSSSLSALISIVFFMVCLFVMLCRYLAEHHRSYPACFESPPGTRPWGPDGPKQPISGPLLDI